MPSSAASHARVWCRFCLIALCEKSATIRLFAPLFVVISFVLVAIYRSQSQELLVQRNFDNTGHVALDTGMLHSANLWSLPTTHGGLVWHPP